MQQGARFPTTKGKKKKKKTRGERGIYAEKSPADHGLSHQPEKISTGGIKDSRGSWGECSREKEQANLHLYRGARGGSTETQNLSIKGRQDKMSPRSDGKIMRTLQEISFATMGGQGEKAGGFG